MDLKHSEDFYIQSLLNHVKLKEIMIKDVIAINVDEPFSRVYENFVSHHIRHLPVVDDKRRVVGLITQRDLYRIQSPRHMEDGQWQYDSEVLDEFILRNVMTPKPFTLGPDNSVAEALMAIVDYKYGCIPVVDKDSLLIGIITQRDILKIGAQILREGK